MNGLEFKAWRNNAGLSLRDVESLSLVDKSTISRFENGVAIAQTSYRRLEHVVNSKEKVLPRSKITAIKFHIQQIEILLESEGD